MTEKFEFIDAEYAVYQESDDEHVPSIVKLCRWLDVSRSGFYEWRNAPESATAKRRTELALVIRKSFDDSDGTYGYRRVHTDLVAWGVPAGPELVRSIMRELDLEACQPRPWRFSLTEGDGQEHDIPDLVKRDFSAAEPGEKMVGDITYIPTWQARLVERRLRRLPLRPVGEDSAEHHHDGRKSYDQLPHGEPHSPTDLGPSRGSATWSPLAGSAAHKGQRSQARACSVAPQLRRRGGIAWPVGWWHRPELLWPTGKELGSSQRRPTYGRVSSEMSGARTIRFIYPIQRMYQVPESCTCMVAGHCGIDTAWRDQALGIKNSDPIPRVSR